MISKTHTYNDPDVLLTDFQNGKEAALEYVYCHHHPSLLAYTMRLLNDEDEANDVINESFVKLWEKRKLFNSIKGLVGYLYAIIRNTAYAAMREAKKYNQHKTDFVYLSDKFDELEHMLDTEEIRAKLMQLIYQDIQEMPPQMKAVFQLAYLEGKLAPEIANILSVSVNTVQTHKKAGMKKIRLSLRKKGFTNWMIILELIDRGNTLN